MDSNADCNSHTLNFTPFSNGLLTDMESVPVGNL